MGRKSVTEGEGLVEGERGRGGEREGGRIKIKILYFNVFIDNFLIVLPKP
jgi:hypothetical protein